MNSRNVQAEFLQPHILDRSAASYELQRPPRMLIEGNGMLALDDEEACIGRAFYLGETCGGWTMTAAPKKRVPVMQLGAVPGAKPAHCFDGHVAVLSGTMSQTLVTEAGVNYRLAYETYGAGLAAGSASARSVCDVMVDGIVVQTIVAGSGPGVVSRETYFAAQSEETLLSFSTVGRVPFTLGNATASKVMHLSPFCHFLSAGAEV